MVSKVFKATTRTKPLDFEIEYEDADGEVHTAAFRARPRMGAKSLLRFANAVTTDDETGKVSMGDVGDELISFLTRAVVNDERERFAALIEDDDVAIDLSTLTELGGWLATEYSGRPTGEDSDGTSAPSPDGTGSTGGLSAGATTYSRVEQPLVVSTTS